MRKTNQTGLEEATTNQGEFHSSHIVGNTWKRPELRRISLGSTKAAGGPGSDASTSHS